jgi:hypothetical protein
MKTFKDLTFEKHPVAGFGTQAKLKFDNGYGISVITGSSAYGDGAMPYEAAVLLTNGSLCYDTPVTDDVMGHLSADSVTDRMKQIQQLPAI